MYMKAPPAIRRSPWTTRALDRLRFPLVVDSDARAVSLGLAKAMNARDLGGYPAGGGLMVRRGVLFRADALHRLSEEDVAAVARLKLACVIDFRSPEEIEFVGPDRLPTPSPGRLVALPIHDPDRNIFLAVSLLLDQTKGGVDRDSDRDVGDGWAVTIMLELYRWFAGATAARQAFAAALRLIAAPDALPLLFHCTAGKDRTGWLSALVLSALGVDREVIIEDYVRTNERNAASNAYVLDLLARRVPDPAALVPLLQARPEYLEAAFMEVERLYGDIDGYLREGLELDEATLAALRANLLTAPL